MKKTKLFASIISLCFALAVLTFGVFAANQVNYTISGNISYQVSDVYVDVTTSVYRAKTYMSRLDVRNAIDDASAEATNENPTPLATTITSNTNFALVSEISDHFDTINADEDDPYTLEDLDLEFSTQSGSEAYAYFFIINVKKLSNDVPNVWVAIADELTEIENTYIYDNMYVDVLDSVSGSNLIVAIALDDQTTGIDTLDEFTFGVKMGTGDIATSDWMLDKLSFTLNDEDENDVYYEVSQADDDIAGLVVIPASYQGTPVKAIGEGAFSWLDNLREIYIPTSINALGEWSIGGNINNINFQNFSGTQVPDGCFYATSLVKLIVPNSVTNIGTDTFGTDDSSDLKYLSYLELPSDLEEIAGRADNINSAFQYYSDSLKQIVVRGSKAENDVYYSENNCLIKKDGTDRILYVASNGAVIPSDVTKISDCAFKCSEWITSISLPNVTEVGYDAFMECTNLCRVNLPLLEDIGVCVFHTCRGLTEINFGNVTTIGWSAFYGCTNLTSIDLSNVTTIGRDAFYGCEGLVTITLSESLTNIGPDAFNNTPWLENLTSNANGLIFATAGSVKYLLGFDNTKVTNNFVITADMMANVRGIYHQVLRNQPKISKITIPTSVKFIGYNAFYDNASTLTVEYLATTAQDIPILLNYDGTNGNAETDGGMDRVNAVKIPSGTTSIYSSVWTYYFANYASKVSEAS